ncbi:hypothetical protein H7J77_07980 [Mycolicibacillus parakoreensis]|uniref:Uncharacterized protein n=1 Tax=Mycolicibacillus parakoreensis TaxID=1069221 RepID=A0ABY3U2S1_9MYCO|nr:hypothetical protein [Mycolicibacillus parakoreensis]MCV7315477.1 hypothetical protein [Mycolicibacillus parakoreensis]ULN52066.1 hypothetical protein MIU77_14520 [Mycolicibacillus parakoreensis]
MRLVNDRLAVPARLTRPSDHGFVILAAEVGRWAGPLAAPSGARRRLCADLRALSIRLAERDDVASVVVFRGVFRPPGEGSALLARHGVRPARHDVVVLIRTRSVGALEAVRADDTFGAMVARIDRCAPHGYRAAADNAARIADVDHGRDSWFLFNYFHGDDPDSVYRVWEYTAGWFQRRTALADSTLLRPLPDASTGEDPLEGRGDDLVSLVNHASWPALRLFLPALLFDRSFRSFVLANFAANGVAAQPILYRRAWAAGRRP